MGVNTYTGLSNQQKKFYDRVLLERLTPRLVFLQHGQKRPIPKREGATIDFRRYNRLLPTTKALTEGITPQGNTIEVTNVTATVKGHGDYVVLSDLLDMAGVDPAITETTEVMGEQAGESLDGVVRDVVASGTNALLLKASGTPSSRADVDSPITGAVIRRMRQIMARNNVKNVQGAGAYIAFIHPDVAYDIMSDNSWANANLYAGSTRLFDGEIGKLYGVRFIETTMAPIYTGEGASSADVYGKLPCKMVA